MDRPTQQPDAPPPAAAVADAPAAPPERLPDIAYQLYFGQFQQLAVLAVALAGGALLMHQVGLFKGRMWAGIIAAIVFAAAALFAVVGTFELTRGVTEGKDIRKSMKGITIASMFLLGVGTGLVIMGLLRTALAS